MAAANGSSKWQQQMAAANGSKRTKQIGDKMKKVVLWLLDWAGMLALLWFVWQIVDLLENVFQQ